MFHVLRRAPRITSSNVTSAPGLRPYVSWVISVGMLSRGTKIAWRCITCETMPVNPRRSMIHPDDYDIGPPAQSKFGSQLVPHPPNSNLSSDLTSARTQMTAQISTHLHLRSWIHSSNPHQPRSPHELKIHPNMRAQSLTTVGPPANHSCELGGSGDSHRHLVVLLLHLKYFSFSCC